VKLGDEVAVLRIGGTVAQVADPGTLLADPTDDFVADFVGRDRGYRGLTFRQAPELSWREEPWVLLGDQPATHVDAAWLLVVDHDTRPLGWIEPAALRGAPIERHHLHRGGTVARRDGSARSVLDAALSSPSGRGVVVDDDGVLLGTVTAGDVVAALNAHPGSSAAGAAARGGAGG
jgi:osmoprotectant transport system ATP-binding protein